MGIYPDGNIYGVSFILDGNIIFKKKYETIMDSIQLNEIKDYYDILTFEEQNKLSIHFYSKCVSTYNTNDSSSFITSFPGNKALLEKLFKQAE